jgi:PHD/YefM family antitoxin component YafN of YafNO toxin-antitoxin module
MIRAGKMQWTDDLGCIVCLSKEYSVSENQRQAIFAGLIQNENGDPVDVTYLGGEAFYVIPDGDFRRHVEAVQVDEEVLRQLREQMAGMEDQVVDGVLKYLGKEDLFTKASIDLALKNFDKAFRLADPEQWKPWLGILGFRIIVDVHGDVVRIESPEQEIDDL